MIDIKEFDEEIEEAVKRLYSYFKSKRLILGIADNTPSEETIRIVVTQLVTIAVTIEGGVSDCGIMVKYVDGKLSIDPSVMTIKGKKEEEDED